MWRIRLFLERVGWKPIAIGAAIVVAVLVAAGAAFALLSGGDESSAATTTAPQERTNLYYLRAVAPKVAPNGCSMRIRFIWKPDYHAIQYLGDDRGDHGLGNRHRRLVQEEVHPQGPVPRCGPGFAARRLQAVVGAGDGHGRRSARKRHHCADRDAYGHEVRLIAV